MVGPIGITIKRYRTSSVSDLLHHFDYSNLISKITPNDKVTVTVDENSGDVDGDGVQVLRERKIPSRGKDRSKAQRV